MAEIYALRSVPRAEAYRKALQQAGLSPGQKRILLMNRRAPDATITATTVASALGYKKWNAVNGLYGRMAGKIADRLNTIGALSEKLPINPDKNKPLKSAVIARIILTDENGTWAWCLYPELCSAIDGMGWRLPMSVGE